MAGALVQGVPGSTLDTDLWLDLPSRGYMRVLNLCRRLGFHPVRPTVVVLDDDSLVNFCYHIDGVDGFDKELDRCIRRRIEGVVLPVMCLESILKRKRAAGREKDRPGIRLIERAIACRRTLRRQRPGAR